MTDSGAEERLCCHLCCIAICTAEMTFNKRDFPVELSILWMKNVGGGASTQASASTC